MSQAPGQADAPDAPVVESTEVSLSDGTGDADAVALGLCFTAPLLGLEHLSRFAMVVLHEDSYLFSLVSLEDPGVRLLVLAPGEVFADYSPDFDAVSRAAVGLRAGDAALVLVVVNAGASLAESTANLLAPILVNPVTGDAAQIVLTGTDHPLRAPLTA